MIDLHVHTDYSDGTCTPQELLELARREDLDALAVTDHDTVAGYDALRKLEAPERPEVICGIEVTCKLHGRPAHLLGYFLGGEPGEAFRRWLEHRHEQRRERNRRLTRRLQALGAGVELEEVEALGRSMTGRPHFARVLMDKGYVDTYEEAFERYIGEEGLAYVPHEAPSLDEGIARVNEAGGVSSLAHPVRLGPAFDEHVLRRLVDAGLRALEVFHSDHSGEESSRYLEMARRHDLAVTGGSDFHGPIKPRVRLGGPRVENWVLEELRERFG
jgi:predicted metal-dependent phosphoesterase TrpH